MLRQWLPVVAVAFLLAPCQLACGARHTPDEKKPLGVLPTAVTTAEPLWIPERILAGAPHEADARESRLAELRRLTSPGERMEIG